MGNRRQIKWLIFFRAGLLLLGMGLATAVQAQPGYQLRLLPLDTTAESLESTVKFETTYPDSQALVTGLHTLLEDLRSRAFLEASVDTLDCRDSICLAIMHVGDPYQWTHLKNGNIDESFLDQTGFRERLFKNKPFSYSELLRAQESLLEFAENHGYPFARVWLDSIQILPGRVQASLFMERNALILMDTLTIRGNARISRQYLSHYLGLQQGSLYNRERILRSRERLRELPFLRASSDPQVLFKNDRAAVTFDLEKERASRFDFLIGVLPRSQTTGGMLITGNFEGELINAFGLGERLYAQFEQLRPQTQELHLAFDYPYALGLPVGTDFEFALFKNDTTFLNLELDLGLSYLFEGGNYLKAFWNQYNSNLLTIDEDRLLQTQRLPENLDLSNTTLGLESLFQRLDYRFNPRRGWSALLRAGAGLKRIRRNNQIEALELGYLYDSLQERSVQYRLEAKLAGYLPLFNRSTFKIGATGGFMLTGQEVYRNEQFRIGGNRLLRGFDEESIFASRYAVGTLEYRMLLGLNSYLYVFGDGAWVLNRTPAVNESFFPYGFGTGITFDTKVGLFGVSLAFGSISGTPVDFARPKVHFGYVSLF